MIREKVFTLALVAVSSLLLLSATGNYWLFKDRDEVRSELATANAALKTARDAGALCSASVERLGLEAKEAATRNEGLIEAAKKTNGAQQVKAIQILATPATRPGNDCGSATDRGLNWLKGRAK